MSVDYRKRKFFFTQSTFKAGLTLNDLSDTTCMTHDRSSNFNLIKDDITKENTKMKKLTRPDYNLQPQFAFYQQGNYTRVIFMSIILPTQL